jgi:hypothetical protein
MNAEAKCRLRLDRYTFSGTARLDAQRLAFRGATTLTLALADIRSAQLGRDGELQLSYAGGEAVLELDPPSLAAAWLKKIPRTPSETPTPPAPPTPIND